MQGMGARKRAVFLQLGQCFFVEKVRDVKFYLLFHTAKRHFRPRLAGIFSKKSINFHFHGV